MAMGFDRGARRSDPSFLILLGALRDTIAGKRQVLGHIVTMKNGPEGVQVSEQIEEMAWRIVQLEALAVLLERLLPHQEATLTLAAHNPIPDLVTYRLRGPADLLDGRDVLGVMKVQYDMGPLVQAEVAGDGYTRYVQIARSAVLAVAR